MPVGVKSRIDRRTLIVPCDCGLDDHTFRFDFWLEWIGDEGEEMLLDVAIKSDSSTSWRDRLRIIRAALRGQSAYFSSVVLDRPSASQLSEFLTEFLAISKPD